MNYIQRLAQEIRHEVPEGKLPHEDMEALFLAYATLLLAKGGQVAPADVHNAWAAWMTTIDPSHEALKPFEELDTDTRQQDSPYLVAIRTVASRR